MPFNKKYVLEQPALENAWSNPFENIPLTKVFFENIFPKQEV